MHINYDWIVRYGYWGLFAGLLLEIVGLPIPGEGMLTFAGYMIYKGKMSLVPTLAASLAGSAMGISISYVLGRTLGYRALHRFGPRFGFSEAKLARVHDWFERVGKWTLTIGYFIPGVRHLTGFSAGASELEIPVFALFAYPGCVLWSVSLISLGYYLGEGWARWAPVLHRGVRLGTLAVVGIIVLYGLIIVIQHLRHGSHP
jgi:membrane protein DedA with SNARE-associated domain